MPDLEGNKKGEETSAPLHAYKEGRGGHRRGDHRPRQPGARRQGQRRIGRVGAERRRRTAGHGRRARRPEADHSADPGGAVGSLSKDNPVSPTESGKATGTGAPLDGPQEGDPGAGQQGTEGQPPRR